MVVRSAVGALCTVAVLGAVAMALPERSNSKSTAENKAPQFGALTKASFTPPDGGGQGAGEDRSKLLKLASLSSAQTQPAPVVPQIAPAAVQNAPAAVPSSPIVTQASPVPSASTLSPSAAPKAAPPAVIGTTRGIDLSNHAPVVEAKVDDSQDAAATSEPPAAPEPAPAPARSKGKSAAIDINRASEDTLDHLPGGGRIGHSIVTHRPYRSIEDLLHKRVLRLSAYQRIQSAIKAD